MPAIPLYPFVYTAALPFFRFIVLVSINIRCLPIGFKVITEIYGICQFFILGKRFFKNIQLPILFQTIGITFTENGNFSIYRNIFMICTAGNSTVYNPKKLRMTDILTH